jgi:hypothetical protein
MAAEAPIAKGDSAMTMKAVAKGIVAVLLGLSDQKPETHTSMARITYLTDKVNAR